MKARGSLTPCRLKSTIVLTSTVARTKKKTNAHGRLNRKMNRDWVKDNQPTISQNFASPEGEGFPPSPKETLNRAGQKATKDCKLSYFKIISFSPQSSRHHAILFLKFCILLTSLFDRREYVRNKENEGNSQRNTRNRTGDKDHKTSF